VKFAAAIGDRPIVPGRKPVGAGAIAGFIIFAAAGAAVDIRRKCSALPGL
jgi:hypothetical protein